METTEKHPTLTQLTPLQIDEICYGYDGDTGKYHNLSAQVGFAGMALLGMMRHSKESADWYAHNALWAASCHGIGQIISPTPSGIGISPKADKLIEKIKLAVKWDGSQKE